MWTSTGGRGPRGRRLKEVDSWRLQEWRKPLYGVDLEWVKTVRQEDSHFAGCWLLGDQTSSRVRMPPAHIHSPADATRSVFILHHFSDQNAKIQSVV